MFRMGLFLKRRLSLGNGSTFKESFRLPIHWILVRKIAHVHAFKQVLMYFPPLCRGGPPGPGTKCPLQISEMVSIYNYAQEALAQSDSDLRDPSYEFWDCKSCLLKENCCGWWKLANYF